MKKRESGGRKYCAILSLFHLVASLWTTMGLGFALGHNGSDSRHAPLFMPSILGLSPEPCVDLVWTINLQIWTMAQRLIRTMDSESRWARFIPINACKSLCSPQHKFVLASLPSHCSQRYTTCPGCIYSRNLANPTNATLNGLLHRLALDRRIVGRFNILNRTWHRVQN